MEYATHQQSAPLWEDQLLDPVPLDSESAAHSPASVVRPPPPTTPTSPAQTLILHLALSRYVELPVISARSGIKRYNRMINY